MVVEGQGAQQQTWKQPLSVIENHSWKKTLSHTTSLCALCDMFLVNISF